MKDSRAMCYCEDGDSYPSKADGRRVFNLAVWLAAQVTQARA
ncbi:MAG TPA: hypothetical protein PLP57_03950 [Candidatus Saccharicenans sp.]|nr:hypothetical protein [Candidatus Saccharicenans sp.]